MQTGHYL
ncbi:hypothetical protein PENSTE_c031G07369 [Penicillium steckii]|nr:hypothetical protein PENSTE_c031G07369 [Penicillium steckii]